MKAPCGMHKDAPQRIIYSSKEQGKPKCLVAGTGEKLCCIQSIEYSIAIGNYGDFVVGMTGVSKNLMEGPRSSLPKAHASAN